MSEVPAGSSALYAASGLTAGEGFEVVETGPSPREHFSPHSRFGTRLAPNASPENKAHLILGRFHVCRALYRISRRLFDGPAAHAAALTPYATNASLFGDLPQSDAVRALDRRGFYGDFELPDDALQAICRFANESPCERWKMNDSADGHFLANQVESGRLPDGRLVSVADVVSPLSCLTVAQTAFDREILALFRATKGYAARRVEIRLFWYFALEPSHPAHALLPNHGGLYHYDIPGLDSLYVYFYLTDSDRESGAHAVVEGSHKHKTLPMLFGSRYHSDPAIHDHYRKADENIIERPAGKGFVEDPFCFHKFCPIRKRNRLMLQLRYF